MERFDEDFNMEENPIISTLIEIIRKSQPKVSVINYLRYAQILKAKKAFDALLDENGEEQSVLTFNLMFCSASLTADVDTLEVRNYAGFLDIMRDSNNFEVIPLENGCLRISFVFNHALLKIE